MRLSANARVSPQLSGRIQAELANAAVGGSAELNEAYALLELSPAVGVLVGKGGRPFGAVDATPASRLVPIERGARFRGAETVEQYGVLESLAYAGRSVGVQVLGDVEGLPVGRLAYAAGYFRGATGEEGDDADIRQFAARVQVSPVPGVGIGLAATSRAFGRDTPPGVVDGRALGGDPAGETERGAAYALDVVIGDYGRPGLVALAEVAAGTFDPFRDQRFVSAQGWVAYRLPVGDGPLVAVEPLFRASVADVDGPLSPTEGVLLTPGLNLYAPGNTRLALNADVFLPGEGDALFAFRSQVQIEF